MPGPELFDRTYVDDYERLPTPNPGQQLLFAYRLELVSGADVCRHEPVDARRELSRERPQSDPELIHGLGREPIADARSFAGRCNQAGFLEDLEVLARVGDRESDLPTQRFHCALSVGEHVDDLCSPAAGERARDAGELIEELDFGRSIWHLRGIMPDRAAVVRYSIDFLTIAAAALTIRRRRCGNMLERRTSFADADPYLLFGLLGKKVIHPGGRTATEQLIASAELHPHHTVLDIGCGVATTAVEIARRFGSKVVAADISVDMRERAADNVRRGRLDDRVTVQNADICELPFPDSSFDRVVAEAVTMFVDRDQAIAEMVRVCRPGGLVLATEFQWRRPPTPEARHAFLGEVCPGMLFDTVEDWLERYGKAGLTDLTCTTGPFEMMTPGGFLADEGLVNSVRVMTRAIAKPVARRRMMWLMPRIGRAVPFLGYVLIRGRKPVNKPAERPDDADSTGA